jgi:formylglycine-generating enzyme required for sulfatase activity
MVFSFLCGDAPAAWLALLPNLASSAPLCYNYLHNIFGGNMAHLFISHDSADDDFVDRLAESLRGHGLTPWVDHQDIPPGSDWDWEVQQAINGCELLMFIVTEAGLASDNCTDEWSHALGQNKLIIPVMLEEDLADEDLPMRLKRRQWVDFRGEYDNAFGDLINWLGLEGKTAALRPPVAFDDERDRSTAKMSRKSMLPLLEWIDIPGGSLSWQGAVHHLGGFRIARYPVTVQQYSYFIREGGYQNRDYWTILGWNWKTENKIIQPAFWEEEPWHSDKHPVVGVGWYEAIAFCKWLSTKSSDVVTLPTEAQWQCAAQGGDDRAYPWGDDFQPHANTMEMGLDGTSPVDRFEAGQSEFGVFDMSGNVWEWCLNEWADHNLGGIALESEEPRSSRGGSWNDGANEARVSHRFGGSAPYTRSNHIGFRIAADADA